MPIAASGAQLDVRGLHLWRGDRHLLRNVSFTLNAAELLQVAGPNGVGKTSLLRCTAGILPAESGEILWRGQSIDSSRDEYHEQLAYLAHVNALKSDLTALENLVFGVGVRRSITNDQATKALDRVEIAHCADLPVRSLSAGQKRRVAIARVCLSEATLWILDEPITNLDVAGIALFERLMSEHLSQGGMILTAAHQMLLRGQPGTRTLELH